VKPFTPEFRHRFIRRVQAGLSEASVPSLRNQGPEKRGIDWPAIVRTLLIQVLVLLALSAAFIRYVNWSSDQAWAEFSAASKSPAPAAKLQPQSATPVQAALCIRKA
jgi:hypothetical protein